MSLYMSVGGHRGQKRASDLAEITGSCELLVWMLGAKPRPLLEQMHW